MATKISLLIIFKISKLIYVARNSIIKTNNDLSFVGEAN